MNFIFSLYFLQLEIKKLRKPNDCPKIKFKYKLRRNSVPESWTNLIDWMNKNTVIF